MWEDGIHSGKHCPTHDHSSNNLVSYLKLSLRDDRRILISQLSINAMWSHNFKLIKIQ
jgi:hypothetical protein